jgi:integrase
MSKRFTGQVANPPKTLATVLSRLERHKTLSANRRRDLRSGVSRIADLLGNEPRAIILDLSAIGAKLASINPVAAGITAKRLSNIRSDFLAAVKVTGLRPVKAAATKALTPAWTALFKRLLGRRAHLGLSRLARYATSHRIEPNEINDEVIAGFIAAVRDGSLHQNPNALYRQTTLIWNEAARDPKSGLQLVTVASFRPPTKRIAWSRLPVSFRTDVDAYLSWATRSDPFGADARLRLLAPRTERLRRHQIHAAASALVDSGLKPSTIRSLADIITPTNFKSVLRRRLEIAGGEANNFNKDLAGILILIARERVKVDAPILAELKRLASKLPALKIGLTDKNKRFLRQFDNPEALYRLVKLPERLWAEVRRDSKPNFRTLAKAQAALAISILTYMPVRLANLASLEFDIHLFVRAGTGAISTLELSTDEVKNNIEVTFDIPPQVAKLLLEYRDRVAPKVIGHRPKRLFVNVDGTPKSPRTVAWLISTYSKRRAGIVVSPHQYRHLAARVLLDAQPGGFEIVRQVLGHRRHDTTVNAYAGIDSRRAGRHHQRLIENAITAPNLSRPNRGPRKRRDPAPSRQDRRKPSGSK